MSGRSEISVLVLDQVATDILGAVEFPLEFNIPGQSLGAAVSNDVPVFDEADILAVSYNQSPQPDDPLIGEFGELFEELITQALERDERGVLDRTTLSSDELELLALLPATGADGRVDLSNRTAEEQTKLEKALTGVVTRGLVDFAILWAQFRVVSRPTAELGNPVRLTGLSTRSRAKAEACIKIFGRRLCARATSPWVRVDGEEIALRFLASGSKVGVKPTFKNLDFVITIRIFGKTFTIKIGFTTLVNRYFDRLPPAEVADLSAFEQSIPFSNKSTRIKTVIVADDPLGVRIVAETEVV